MSNSKELTNKSTVDSAIENVKNMLLVNLPQETPETKSLCDFLLERIENFYLDVIKPMTERDSSFPMSKTHLFFEIYKEGLEANKLYDNSSFSKFITITQSEVDNLVNTINNESFKQLCERGSSFIANSFYTIQNWYRDVAVINRYSLVYGNGNTPLDWIDMYMDNERIFNGVSEFPIDVKKAIDKLTLIMQCNRSSNGMVKPRG